MNKEGFYLVNFAGIDGEGLGMVVFDTGIVCGADVGGVRYDGTYIHNVKTDMLDIDITAKVPPGIPLVTGIPAQDKNYVFKVVGSLPRNIGEETVIPLQTSFGPVNTVFTKLRGFDN
ncbi:MAG: hypothetical protein EYC62_01905 [Alphaproteobacteria bacterium]|nr:MAG: hypothetical protein EYC62_01905 [Alphaproteobacteria bacterium]